MGQLDRQPDHFVYLRVSVGSLVEKSAERSAAKLRRRTYFRQFGGPVVLRKRRQP